MKFRIFTIIPIILFHVSCSTEFSNGYCYPQDRNISDSLGNLKDSNIIILPTKINRENQEKLYTGMDTIFSSKQYSLWKAMGEKILYNYYLDNDQIRFIWFQSLRKEQYVFRFVHDNQKYKVFLKIIRDNKLTRDKDSIDFVKSIEFNEFAKKSYQKYLKQKKYFETDSIVSFNNQSEIAYCKPTEISKEAWNKIFALLDTCQFWNSHPNKIREVLDGETWVTEAHLKNAYWFSYESSPEMKYRKAAEYAIELIGLEDRRRPR